MFVVHRCKKCSRLFFEVISEAGVPMNPCVHANTSMLFGEGVQARTFNLRYQVKALATMGEIATEQLVKCRTIINESKL